MKRTVRQWPDASVNKLRGCFECTDWQVSDCGDLDEYSETVTAYISFCEDLCLPTKTVTQYPNNKPWFDSRLRAKLRAKDEAYKTRNTDPMCYKRTTYDLEKAFPVVPLTGKSWKTVWHPPILRTYGIGFRELQITSLPRPRFDQTTNRYQMN